jgi:hypothetical protein
MEIIPGLLLLLLQCLLLPLEDALYPLGIPWLLFLALPCTPDILLILIHFGYRPCLG